MQDSYDNFKERCYINDLPPEQFFNDHRINLIGTKTITIGDKQYNVSSDVYNTNVLSYINLSAYKFIYSIRHEETVVNSYNVFNIVVCGITHATFNKSDVLTTDQMSSLCLDKADELNKVMTKFLKGF